jgi:hypothetical protein
MIIYIVEIILVVIVHIHRLIHIKQLEIKIHYVEIILVRQQDHLVIQIIQHIHIVYQQVIFNQVQHIYHHHEMKVVLYMKKHLANHIMKLNIDVQVQHQVYNHHVKLNISVQVVHH